MTTALVVTGATCWAAVGLLAAWCLLIEGRRWLRRWRAPSRPVVVDLPRVRIVPARDPVDVALQRVREQP